MDSLFSIFFFSSRRRHTRFSRDWSSDVCSSDLTSDLLGRTSDVRPSKSEVVVVSEPETGAQLRTKGRLYLLCEVAGPGSPTTGVQVAREVADLTKQEYYYDLSGGIEVSLRRALRQANRRA